jgi:DNA-binding helix-hairpin-helix protein with protein kinase domain
MTPPRVIDSKNNPFPLGKVIDDGVGGEGIVYVHPSDPKTLAKLYKPEKLPLDTDQVERLTYQVTVREPRLLAVTGWPAGLLSDERTRKVIGFTMPKIPGMPIWNLYSPSERLKFFPKATWALQVRAASNLAAAFDEIHTFGYLVGDVSQKNAFVSSDFKVGFIDCDSFQVRTPKRVIPCKVGTPEYVPPELQQQRWDVARTENNDNFGLAVLIYQLLFVSAHPYCGIDRGARDATLADNIRDYRFSQGPDANKWNMAPPPLTPTFADIPADLGTLFRRAFERGSQNNTRPMPREWLHTLWTLEGNISTCAADSGHKYWKGAAGGCVWCRLARNGGPEYYYGAADTGGPFVLDEARLREVLRRLEAVTVTAFRLDKSRLEPTVRPNGVPVPPAILSLKQKNTTDSWPEEKELPPPAELADEPPPKMLPKSTLPPNELPWEPPPKPESEISEEKENVNRALSPEDERDRRTITIILIACIVFGAFLLPFGVHRVYLSVIGFFIVIGFIVLLLIHLTASKYTQSKELQLIRRKILRQRTTLERKNYEIRLRNRSNTKDWKLRNAKIRATNVRRRSEWDAANADIEAANKRARREWERKNQDIRAANHRAREHWKQKNQEIRERNLEARRKRERAYVDALTGERERRMARVREANAQVEVIEKAWSTRVTAYSQRHRELREAIEIAIRKCRELEPAYRSEVQRISANAEVAARHRHLQFFSLTMHDDLIPGIGPRRRQILSDRGINTAADIDESKILRIDGFGPVLTQALLEWKQGVLRSFRFDVRSVQASPEHNAVSLRYGSQQKTFLNMCEQQLRELSELAPTCRAVLTRLEQELSPKFIQVQQARADLQVVEQLIAAA